MDRAVETKMWGDLWRHRPLKEYLEEQLQAQYEILAVNPDVEKLRMAQGRAQFIKQMLDRLTAAESAAKKQ